MPEESLPRHHYHAKVLSMLWVRRTDGLSALGRELRVPSTQHIAWPYCLHSPRYSIMPRTLYCIHSNMALSTFLLIKKQSNPKVGGLCWIVYKRSFVDMYRVISHWVCYYFCVHILFWGVGVGCTGKEGGYYCMCVYAMMSSIITIDCIY